MNDCGAQHRFIRYFTMYQGSIACANTDLTRSAFHNFHLAYGSHTGAGRRTGIRHTHHLFIQRCFSNFNCNVFFFFSFFDTRYLLRLNVESLCDSLMATPNFSFFIVCIKSMWRDTRCKDKTIFLAFVYQTMRKMEIFILFLKFFFHFQTDWAVVY